MRRVMASSARYPVLDSIVLNGIDTLSLELSDALSFLSLELCIILFSGAYEYSGVYLAI